tara:strand:+ start:628 stop:1887 length:1260 start_codon:yes stop_codon:yes gene_type:complete
VKIIESVRLMGGDLLIQRFDDRPSFQARLYVPQKRRYITRSLRTTDLSVATDRAITLWRDLSPLIEKDIPVNAGSIQDIINDYLAAQDRRVQAGEILFGTRRDNEAQLRPVALFCKLQGLKKLTDIKPHTFNGFAAWRRDESLIYTTGAEGILRRTSLNKAIRELRAWWKWVRAQHLADFDLELKEVSSRKEEVREKNVAFQPDDWKRIEQELHRWTFTEQKRPDWANKKMRPIHWYGRHVLYYLISLLSLTGLRPEEATKKITWDDIEYHGKGKVKAARYQDPRCIIRVRNPEGKGSRPVVNNAGVILRMFRQYADKWRYDNGYPAIKGSDLVFAYPPTNKPYSYSHFGNLFRKLLKKLDLQGKGYTIRSCRSTYVTDMLAKGKSPYVISRNTGHSLEILRRNYEQLSEGQLANELLK